MDNSKNIIGWYFLVLGLLIFSPSLFLNSMALNLGSRSLIKTVPHPLNRTLTLSKLHKFCNSKYSLRRLSQMSDNRDDPIQSVIICGPSGVGKGTLINKLLTDFPQRYALSVSHTSRAPRPGEINGVHYHFVDKEFMMNDIKNGPWKYLENAEVHGNLYGTREDAVRNIHQTGKICILDLDTCGVRQLKASKFPVYLVFVAPPSMRELETRLRGRGTEREEQIQTRVKNAQKEIEFGMEPGNVDVILTNDNFEEAYTRLVKQLDEWFPQISSGSK